MLRDRPHLSNRGRHHLRAVLRTALNKALRQGKVTRNAAALAERRFGAGAGSAGAPGCTVFIALGTGIGAALLVDGALYRGAHRVARPVPLFYAPRSGRAGRHRLASNRRSTPAKGSLSTSP